MDFDNLHQILRSLYEQMMPLCGDMAGVAKGIAGLGALFYVAYRVWQSLARAEPIDAVSYTHLDVYKRQVIYNEKEMPHLIYEIKKDKIESP